MEQPESGLGTTPSRQDEMWQAAAAELAPDKSLARLETKAGRLVGYVSVVGAVLTGLGLVAGELLAAGPARWLALVSVGVAVIAVALAMASSLLRFRPAMAVGNLAEVEGWYRTEFRRAYPVMAAGWLMLLALALAGAAAILSIVDRREAQPELTIQSLGSGPRAKLVASAEFEHAAPGRLLRASLVGVTDAGARRLLARAVGRAGGGGKASARMEVAETGSFSAVELTVRLGDHLCVLRLPLTPGRFPDGSRCSGQ